MVISYDDYAGGGKADIHTYLIFLVVKSSSPARYNLPLQDDIRDGDGGRHTRWFISGVTFNLAISFSQLSTSPV